MDRRGFLCATAALATATAAAPATAAPAARPAGPSIFDFGAAGDGKTDDSAAFSKALAAAAAEGRVVAVPSFTYAIDRPVRFSSTQHVGSPWGLRCEGATLLSRIDTGEDVLTIGSAHTVRYFRLTGGLKIAGNGREGNGITISVPSGSAFFYNAAIEGLSVERVGRHGILFAGNVFESAIQNSYFQDCGENGATFAHSKGGVCSAISISDCYFNQNGKYGLAATNLDAEYGGATDVRVYGGYCRENKSYGFYYNNGTSPGAAITQVGFENNCKSLAPGDANGAHVYGMVAMQLRNCTGYNEFGGATYLLRGWFTGLTCLESCAQGAGAAMAKTGKSRLVQVNGDAKGHVLMRACGGGVDAVAGTACTWTAEYCSGPSPSGPLNPRSTSSSA
jgi:hypothetical protein